MDRLTIRNSDGSVSQPTSSTFEKVFNRLAEYEDIGLTPEVCRNYKIFEDEAISKNVPFSRIVELMNAEAEGRLIVLPCKVGDCVYNVFGNKIYEMKAVAIPMLISSCGAHLSITTNNGREAALTLELDDFGKTVFLSREEAESALKGE